MHRWSPLLDGFEDLLPVLLARYAEPHRIYHGVDHIAALARLFVEVDHGPGWRSPIEVRLAILFHDAIYEPGRPDNEDRSANLAAAALHGRPIDIARIEMMIRCDQDPRSTPTPRRITTSPTSSTPTCRSSAPHQTSTTPTPSPCAKSSRRSPTSCSNAAGQIF